MENKISIRLRNAAERLKVSSKEEIHSALKTLEIKMKAHMWKKVNSREIFGSFTRDTLLPVEFDDTADVDVLVIFDDENYERTPETYRNQLKGFAQKAFPKAEIKKDFPSVVVENAAIHFDLVPCVTETNFFSGKSYFIPDSQGEWMETDPHYITDELKSKPGRILHLIRLLKYWNVTAQRPFESIDLEKQIIDIFERNGSLASDLIAVIDRLDSTALTSAGADRLNTLKSRAERLERAIDAENPHKARTQLRLIFPNLFQSER